MRYLFSEIKQFNDAKILKEKRLVGMILHFPFVTLSLLIFSCFIVIFMEENKW